jgi:hypothetical protein
MDYDKAARIRKKSFGTLLAEQEGGFGQSFKTAISQKTKAKITGIKETFDPLNIAKKLTGGSNWAPAMLGKMFGVDKKKVDYFSNVKNRNTSSPMDSEGMGGGESMTSATESLGYIYKSLKMERIDKTREREEALARAESEEEFENTRNKELIEAIVGRFGKKRLRDEKGRFVKQDTTRTTTNTPEGMEIPKTRTTPTTPNGIDISKTTKISSTSAVAGGAVISGGTAAVVGGSAIIAGVAVTSASKAIAGAESGNNYDITFGDRVKNGKIQNTKGYPTPEELFGKKLTQMTLAEVKEFGRIRSEKSQNSGATGKYQFMPTTLFGRVKNGSHIPGLVDKLGLPMDTIYSPEIQDRLQELLHTQNIDELKRQGVPITPGYEYMSHYIGAGGAAAVYRSAMRGENITVAQALLNAKLAAPGKENNPELYKLTVGEFESVLAGRLIKHGLSSPHPINDVGNQIDASAKENKDLRAVITSSDASAQTINNNITSSQMKSSGIQPVVGDDTNAYQKKAKV